MTTLSLVLPSQPQPCDEICKMLRDLLAEAEAGLIPSLVVGYVVVERGEREIYAKSCGDPIELSACAGHVFNMEMSAEEIEG